MRFSPGDTESLDDYLDDYALDDDERMSADEVQSLVLAELTEAVSFIDTEVSIVRAEATRAYQGEPYGNEEEGQSDIVSMDVRDSVLGLLPDLLRIFTAGDTVVEYEAESARTVPMAEAATDYANYIFERDNDGFAILHSTFKDALIRKAGFVKFWWDESVRVTTEHYTGLDPLALFVLEQDSEIESIRTTELDGDENKTVDPFTGKPTPLVNAECKRRTKRGRVKLAALPPEEFVIDKRASSFEDFTVIAHRSQRTISDLVALGYDLDDLKELMSSPDLEMQPEAIARNAFTTVLGTVGGTLPNRRVLYTEAYMRLDLDGDGIAELCRVCTVGPEYRIVDVTPTDHLPFAAFHCDPEPHTFFGLSIYDVTGDIQRLKTNVWRNSLDSLAQSVHPRMAAVEGQVNFDDLLNNEVGSVIRMRQIGMVQQLDTPFVGQAAFPMLDYIDSTREMRTGVSKASMGLDPSVMQSTTKDAVTNTISQSQGRVELIARVLADGMRQLFRGILHLVVQNQDKPRSIQLRGQWVDMDPRTWVADLGVSVNIGLGGGTADTKLAALGMVAQKQEQILMQFGPQNPVCSVAQYSNTLKRLVELSGFRDSSQFFNQVPADWKPPQQPPQPNPQLIAAQTQQQAVQIEGQRVQIDAQKAQALDAREREANAADAAIRARELELKYGGQVQSAALDAMNQHAIADLEQQHETARAVIASAQQQQAAQQQAAAQQHGAQMQAAAQAHAAQTQAHAGLAQSALEQQHETHRNAVNAEQAHAAAAMQAQAQAQQAAAAQAAQSQTPSE